MKNKYEYPITETFTFLSPLPSCFGIGSGANPGNALSPARRAHSDEDEW
ncbi:MAG: hypothetical protein IJS00_01585 [Paludibacteraceae bacterium]|nr:hypothetical protein [Paludibacteraceae bacterium]